MNYYMINFALMYNLKFNNISEWDNFLPFEKQIYLDLMKGKMEEERKNKDNNNSIPTGPPTGM